MTSRRRSLPGLPTLTAQPATYSATHVIGFHPIAPGTPEYTRCVKTRQRGSPAHGTGAGLDRLASDDLAKKSGVSEITLKNIERGYADPRASTLAKIQQAFEKAGVVFLDPGDVRDGGEGVRLKKPRSSR
jgi:DNA-binding XRE family transcriptional regulator